MHDNWWQTGTGAIMISNYASMDIRPGSMGRPLPGVDATILERGEDGRAKVHAGQMFELTGPDAVGELALRPGWPSMFRDYLHDPKRYERCFGGGWHLSGDLARRDADGYFWFIGRSGDVIKSAGHLVGSFEVESALMEHPAVAEAGVIGKPDPTTRSRRSSSGSQTPASSPKLSWPASSSRCPRNWPAPSMQPKPATSNLYPS